MKRIVLSLCALLLIGSIAKGEEKFTIENVSLPQNGVAEIQVAYSLEAKNCTGFSFRISLPEGLEYVTDKKGIVYAQGFESDDNPTVAIPANENDLLVTWYSNSAEPIHRKSGFLIALKVKLSDNTTPVGKVFNCSLYSAERSIGDVAEHPANDDFMITVTDPMNRVVLDENSAFDPEETDDDVDVLVKRTITAGQWSTICLPFDLDNSTFETIFGTGTVLAEFDNFSSDDNYETMAINFKTATQFKANTPYLIKTTNDITSFEVNATIEPDDIKVGSSKKGFFYGTYKACTVVPEDHLFISKSNFYYSTGLTMIRGFRGYFYFKEKLKTSAGTRAIISLDGQSIGDGTTGINSLSFIPKNGKVYSISGAFMGEKENLNSLPKGVYIVDGKKVVIK